MDRSVVAEFADEPSLLSLLGEEDLQRMRERHHQLVEAWLNFADFATELFQLHAKYGIEQGEAGYAAYRRHLRTQYYRNMQEVGPVVDPLEEGCDCIFCKMHADESPAEAQEAAEIPSTPEPSPQPDPKPQPTTGNNKQPQPKRARAPINRFERKPIADRSREPTPLSPTNVRPDLTATIDADLVCDLRFTADRASPCQAGPRVFTSFELKKRAVDRGPPLAANCNRGNAH